MEYLWLSIYVKLDYLTYINLLKIFKDAKNIYALSQDKDKFLRLLRLNHIHISYRIFSNLVDSDLKVKSKELFQNLKKQNIKIINIFSIYYPKELINTFNPPLTIFAYGDLSILLNKKVYVYTSNNFSTDGIKVHNEFCDCMFKNNIAILTDILTEYTNILYLPYLKKIDRENLIVISDKLEDTSYINYEYITGSSDCLLIPEANYTIKIAMIVDLMLEQGKYILVIPSSIYNKEAYFSNYLLKDGAVCITSKVDLLNFLR